jgi:hypothetical protein
MLVRVARRSPHLGLASAINQRGIGMTPTPDPLRDHEWCVPHDHVEPDQERWERDQAAALSAQPTPPPLDVERLRRQNHEHAERRDREMSGLRRQVDRYQNAYRRAKELVRGSPVDWSKDPSSQEPDGWWGYTSQSNRDVLMAAVLDAAPPLDVDMAILAVSSVQCGWEAEHERDLLAAALRSPDPGDET